jgi:Spy/CpxP family protein refolding chaperone
MLILRSKVPWLVAGSVAILAVAAGAAAQTAPAPPPVADAQVGFQRPAQLSPQQELAAADTGIARMEQGSTTVSKMLEQARTARDVVKTLCLNDKLSQIDVAVRSAKDRRSALQVAAGRNDQELSNHEFTILTVLRQRGDQLVAEANQCIGEEAAFIGATNVSTTVDTDLPPPDEQPVIDNSSVFAPPASGSSDGK